MTLRLIAAACALTLGLAACSTKPAVAREHTMLTPKQIADMGLECRDITPIETTIPRTWCASPRAWASYEKQGILSTEALFREVRTAPNAGRFNRD